MFCQSKDGSANGTFVISRFKRTGFLQQKGRTPEGKKIPFKLLPEMEPDFAIPAFISMKKIAR